MPPPGEELNPTMPGTRANPPLPPRVPRERSRLVAALPFPLPPRYTFVEIIGRGGMGLVARIYDQELERDVALKAILPGRANAVAVQRFVNEARIMAGLEHPAIMPVHDAGTATDGSYWYTMKLLEGGSLRERLRPARGKGTPFLLQERIGVAIRLAEALGYMHSRNIIHRDLKPENVMLSNWGEVVLMDFGLAKKLDGTSDSESASIMDEEDLQNSQGLTMEGKIMGTPAYMPAEQARGQISMLGPWTDIWALGAILYEMLTGEAPYKAKDVMDVLRMARTGRVEDPRIRARRTGAGEIPPELVSVVLKALALQPNRRYRTADALGKDLAAWMRFDPVSAHQDTSMQRVSRYVRKNPGRVAAMSAAALFALGVSAISAFAMSVVSQAEVEKAQAAESETAARAEAEQQRFRAALQEGKLETLAKDLGVGLKRSGLKALDHMAKLVAEDQAAGGMGSGLLDQITNEQIEEVLGDFGRARQAEQETGTQIVSGRDYAALGQLYSLALRQPVRAIAAFEEALRRDPSLNEDWLVVGRLGVAWVETSDDVRAIPYLRRALELMPEHHRNAALAITFAFALHRTGQFEEALIYYQKSVQWREVDDPLFPQIREWMKAARERRR